MDSRSERADWPEPPAARDGADLDGVPVEEEPVESGAPEDAETLAEAGYGAEEEDANPDAERPDSADKEGQ